MCALWFISICPAASRPIIRKRAEPAAMACRRTYSCSMATKILPCVIVSSKSLMPRTSANIWSARSSMRCSALRKPRVAAGRFCCPISATGVSPAVIAIPAPSRRTCLTGPSPHRSFCPVFIAPVNVLAKPMSSVCCWGSRMSGFPASDMIASRHTV
ncbi:hypothetical protein D3C78_1209510 [compost metagenome]